MILTGAFHCGVVLPPVAILVGLSFIVLILRSVLIKVLMSVPTPRFFTFSTLIGSTFNISIGELPPQRFVSDQVVDFFGMPTLEPRT